MDSYQVRDSLKFSSDEDGGILLDIQQGAVFNFNPIGVFIWAGLRQGMATDDIYQSMRKQFPDTPPKTLESDLQEFVSQLCTAGLILRIPRD